MWAAATTLLLALGQTPPQIDRSGAPVLVQLLERYSKLPSFYLWFDRYTSSGEAAGFDKGGTAQLWFGGRDRSFRISSCGSFGDDVLGVSDGKSLMVDHMNTSQAVELSDMPAKWQDLKDTMAPNQSGCLVLWLMDGPQSLDNMAVKDKPITLTKKGATSILSFTNKDLGEMKIEILDGWMVADEFVQTFDFDGDHFTFVNRDEFKPFVYGPKLPKGVFETKPAKGLLVDDKRKKPEPVKKPPRL